MLTGQSEGSESGCKGAEEDGTEQLLVSRHLEEVTVCLVEWSIVLSTRKTYFSGQK